MPRPRGNKLLSLKLTARTWKWMVGILTPPEVRYDWTTKTYLKHQQKQIWLVVGGWTNPLEKYARQNGFIFLKDRGENIEIQVFESFIFTSPKISKSTEPLCLDDTCEVFSRGCALEKAPRNRLGERGKPYNPYTKGPCDDCMCIHEWWIFDGNFVGKYNILWKLVLLTIFSKLLYFIYLQDVYNLL